MFAHSSGVPSAEARPKKVEAKAKARAKAKRQTPVSGSGSTEGWPIGWADWSRVRPTIDASSAVGQPRAGTDQETRREAAYLTKVVRTNLATGKRSEERGDGGRRPSKGEQTQEMQQTQRGGAHSEPFTHTSHPPSWNPAARQPGVPVIPVMAARSSRYPPTATGPYGYPTDHQAPAPIFLF